MPVAIGGPFDAMKYLGYDENKLRDRDAYWTAREIEQQPEIWLKVSDYLRSRRAEIDAFVQPLTSDPDTRIILTGAGTSAFVGDCLAPILSRMFGRTVEAIATTDLVSSPDSYFHSRIPTLLISFARSGNSPESLAALELAQSMLSDCSQLIITCNEDGALFRAGKECRDALVLLMPAETNDQAFAMTSSFTSMLLAAISTLIGISSYAPRVARVAACVENLIRTRNDEIRQLADNDFSYVVYLGSNSFSGLAKEASLKLLELTDGRIHTMHDSPLGVRHGPKASINDDTLVVVFMSSDSYTRKYDTDILNEFSAEGQVRQIVALTAENDLNRNSDLFMTVENTQDFSDLELLFPYVAVAQMYGFHSALRIGNRPDNPSASGTVNRVVQGVKIYSRPA